MVLDRWWSGPDDGLGQLSNVRTVRLVRVVAKNALDELHRQLDVREGLVLAVGELEVGARFRNDAQGRVRLWRQIPEVGGRLGLPANQHDVLELVVLGGLGEYICGGDASSGGVSDRRSINAGAFQSNAGQIRFQI